MFLNVIDFSCMKMGLNNFTCLSTSALFFIHMLFDV